jgi:steroid 5-alpha reductase family enzyme
MTLLLMKVSGVPLLEKRMAETRPKYAEYARKTPAFFPWRPKE